MRLCKIEGCNNKHVAKGYCGKHYMRVCNNGNTDLLDLKKYNKYTLNNNIYEIHIDSPKYGNKIAFISIKDYEEVKKYTWRLRKSPKTFYVQTSIRINKKKITKILHQIIFPDAKEIDHIDGNGLNNIRENLRECTTSQNSMNRRIASNNKTGFKCVFWSKANKKYKAQITKDNIQQHLGYFDDPIEAARAYDRKAIELFEERAYLNFPREDYD